MTSPLQPPIRKTALAAANYHVAVAGVVLSNAGVPKDADELKLLREVLRLLKLRLPEPSTRAKDLETTGTTSAGAKSLEVAPPNGEAAGTPACPSSPDPAKQISESNKPVAGRHLPEATQVV